MSSNGRPRSLPDLQRFQREFDCSRGFDPPHGGESLDGLEFAALAIAGEVGEVANLLKKVRRARWRGEEASVDQRDLEAEVADIFAYVLKLSNLAGIDLADAYQKKMRFNGERFAPKLPAVTVMGAPGAGKTTTVVRLADRFPSYIENARRNPFLEEGQWPRPKGALQSQYWFLTEARHAVLCAKHTQPLLIDQDPRAIVEIYAEMMTERGWLEPAQLEQLRRMLGGIEDSLGIWPDGWHAVLLDAEPDVLAHRLRERDGREPLVKGHLHELCHAFREQAGKMPNVTILKTDELAVDEVIDAVQQQIRQAA